jgi:hypothetical protein
MPDVAFFTFILTISSRRQARAAGKTTADATTGPDGYIYIAVETNNRRGTMNWVGNSLGGYYKSVRRAIFISLALRAVFAGWLLRWIFRRCRRLIERRQ